MFKNVTLPLMSHRKRVKELTPQLKRKYSMKINIVLLHYKSGYKYEVVNVY